MRIAAQRAGGRAAGFTPLLGQVSLALLLLSMAAAPAQAIISAASGADLPPGLAVTLDPHAEVWGAAVQLRAGDGTLCTGTVVGPRVVLTAAACVQEDGGTAQIVLPDARTMVVRCSSAPARGANPSSGAALCRGLDEIPVPAIEAFATPESRRARPGDTVLFAGYGCRAAAGGVYGTKALGVGSVFRPAEERASGGTADLVTRGSALCAGDAGAGALLFTDGGEGERHVVGVGVRGNRVDLSIFAPVDGEAFRAWALQWAEEYGQIVCGLTDTGADCREPPTYRQSERGLHMAGLLRDEGLVYSEVAVPAVPSAWAPGLGNPLSLHVGYAPAEVAAQPAPAEKKERLLGAVIVASHGAGESLQAVAGRVCRSEMAAARDVQVTSYLRLAVDHLLLSTGREISADLPIGAAGEIELPLCSVLQPEASVLPLHVDSGWGFENLFNLARKYGDWDRLVADHGHAPSFRVFLDRFRSLNPDVAELHPGAPVLVPIRMPQGADALAQAATGGSDTKPSMEEVRFDKSQFKPVSVGNGWGRWKLFTISREWGWDRFKGGSLRSGDLDFVSVFDAVNNNSGTLHPGKPVLVPIVSPRQLRIYRGDAPVEAALAEPADAAVWPSAAATEDALQPILSSSENAKCKVSPPPSDLNYPFDVVGLLAALQENEQYHPREPLPPVKVLVADSGLVRAAFKLLPMDPPDGGWQDLQPINQEDEASLHGTQVASLVVGGPLFARIHAMMERRIALKMFRIYDYVLSSETQKTLITVRQSLFNEVISLLRTRNGIVNLSLQRKLQIDGLLSYIKDQKLVLFVVAAGNQSASLVKNPAYPAAYGGASGDGRAHFITVASIEPGPRLAHHSNRGAGVVEIGAPGCEMPVFTRGKHGSLITSRAFGGTSLAAPLVTFAAALTRYETDRDIAMSEIKKRLLTSADLNISGGKDVQELQKSIQDGRVLNILKAVRVHRDLVETPGEPGEVNSGTAVFFRGDRPITGATTRISFTCLDEQIGTSDVEISWRDILKIWPYQLSSENKVARIYFEPQEDNKGFMTMKTCFLPPDVRIGLQGDGADPETLVFGPLPLGEIRDYVRRLSPR